MHFPDIEIYVKLKIVDVIFKRECFLLKRTFLLKKMHNNAIIILFIIIFFKDLSKLLT